MMHESYDMVLSDFTNTSYVKRRTILDLVHNVYGQNKGECRFLKKVHIMTYMNISVTLKSTSMQQQTKNTHI